MRTQSILLPLGSVAAILLAACGGSDYIDLTDPRDLELRENYYGLTVADIDGDGFNDIVSATTVTEDRRVLNRRMSVYPQNAVAPGFFLNPVHISLAGFDVGCWRCRW